MILPAPVKVNSHPGPAPKALLGFAEIGLFPGLLMRPRSHRSRILRVVDLRDQSRTSPWCWSLRIVVLTWRMAEVVPW
jgi:hypothetical protein